MNEIQPLPGASVAALIVLSAVLTGCVTSNVEQIRHSATAMAPGDAIALLGRRQAGGYETEQEFVQCVGKSLDGELSVIPERDFVDMLYPWFEPRIAPLKASDLPELLSYEPVKERLTSSGVKYVVWIDGSTNTTDSSGALTCTLSPAGGGCFGFVSWEQDSSYESTIWDVRTQKGVGKISSDASGTSFMPAVIIPVPLIARVRASACNVLADQLQSFLTQEQP